MNLLFVGLAVALGWGLRGEIGGEQGALIPGALLGLALVIASGKKHWRNAAPVIAAAGALGMSLGGIQSYGILIGYTRGIDILNVSYGYLMLAVVGGLWGAFCAGIIGMTLSDKRKGIPFWIFFLIALYISSIISYFLLIKVFKLLMTPPRVENWAYVLGAVVALFVINFVQKEHKTCRLVLRGFLVGAIGFMLGESLQIYGSFLGPHFDWWKVMEVSFGFVLGIGIAYAVFREYPEDKPIMNVSPFFYVLTIFIILAFIPMIIMNNLLEQFEKQGILIRGETIWVDPYFNTMLRGIAISLIAFFAYWKWFKQRDTKTDPEWQIQFLWLWTIWSNGWITQMLMMIPKAHHISIIIHGFFLFLMILLSLWSIQGRFSAPVIPLSSKPVQGYKWVLSSFLIIPLLALFFAVTSITTHPGEMPEGSHKRFEWNTSMHVPTSNSWEEKDSPAASDTTKKPSKTAFL
ncbi:MAG TPA: hypothetical protein PLX23_08395 [Candidatus Hydrogenedens sp.]|nr:hypothetical protein [Candidatus Hydrogenedens sp.]